MQILETALYAPELDTAAAFYDRILDFERIATVPGRHVFYRVGDGVLLLFNPHRTVDEPEEGRPPVPPHGTQGAGHICFAASGDEIDGWKQRLTRFGVEIEADFSWPQGGRSLYFRDPSGNSLEFAEPRIWSPSA